MSERDWMGLEMVEAPAAEREQLLRVHTAAHVDAIEAHVASGGGMIDMDTIASEGSWEAALHAAGGAAAAAERLLAEGGGFAFCGTRPPGHHAERARGDGLLPLQQRRRRRRARGRGLRRRARADLRLGRPPRQRDRGDLLRGPVGPLREHPPEPALSGHRRGDATPGAARARASRSTCRCRPARATRSSCSLTQEVVAPAARELEPGILFLSAGYDAHRDDPLAQCEVTEEGYRRIAATFAALGEELGVPVVICLEGGYNVTALADSVVATIEGMQALVAGARR